MRGLWYVVSVPKLPIASTWLIHHVFRNAPPAFRPVLPCPATQRPLSRVTAVGIAGVHDGYIHTRHNRAGVVAEME